MEEIVHDTSAKQITGKFPEEHKTTPDKEELLTKSQKRNRRARRRKAEKKRQAEDEELYPEINDLLEYFPGFILNHNYHVLYDGTTPKVQSERKLTAMKNLKLMVTMGRITFTPIVKCPATTIFPSIDGLQTIGDQDSWRTKDLKEILLRWPDRLIMEMLTIVNWEYTLAQQTTKSEELKKLFDQFQDMIKKQLS